MPIFHIFVSLEPNHSHLEWQHILMEMFFEKIRPHAIDRIANNKPFDDFCDLKGIRCCDGEVRTIEYFEFKHGDFNVNAAPPTTRNLSIADCAQCFRIETRSLPRDSELISLSVNRIHGHIDLMTLPPKLVRGYFYDNQITGPIVLTNLPSSLELLNLGRNPIFEEAVLYGNLPPHIDQITFPARRAGVGIQQLIPLSPEQDFPLHDSGNEIFVKESNNPYF